MFDVVGGPGDRYSAIVDKLGRYARYASLQLSTGCRFSVVVQGSALLRKKKKSFFFGGLDDF
jgi:hypothetical protein